MPIKLLNKMPSPSPQKTLQECVVEVLNAYSQKDEMSPGALVPALALAYCAHSGQQESTETVLFALAQMLLASTTSDPATTVELLTGQLDCANEIPLFSFFQKVNDLEHGYQTRCNKSWAKDDYVSHHNMEPVFKALTLKYDQMNIRSCMEAEKESWRLLLLLFQVNFPKSLTRFFAQTSTENDQLFCTGVHRK